mmetsp:Transcript_114242/g.170896  ORF Transcript_114242/g.170896 Transcript_114242/m.170896 type:complete len:83 (-) Transcript_114242:264-512(-)
MICEDFTFYWSHRLLHHKALYPHMHKIHHEYNNPIALGSDYAHPIEYMVSNIIPNTIGPTILGTNVHMVTFIMWMIIRVFET